MRALIVGLGSIGRRHLANLRKLAPMAHITVWHQHATPQQEAASPSGANRVVYRLEDALDPVPDLAVLAGPAPVHIPAAQALAGQGVHLLIEKPLSDAFHGVDDLIGLCRQRRLVAMVGYVLRFSKPLQDLQQAVHSGRIGRPISIRAEVGQHLPDWRPGSDYRTSVTARSELGGGAVLELSHELDYARWLMGEVRMVWGRTARLSELTVDVEDVAEILLEFESKAIGSVHLDLIQRPWVRACHVVGTEGTLTWDGFTNQVRCYEASARKWIELHPAKEINRNLMYVEELRHFLECVERREEPAVLLEDGKRVLELALGAKQSSKTGEVIRL